MSKFSGMGLLMAGLVMLAGCNKPLAQVNGKKITLKDYNEQLTAYEGMRQGQPADINTRRAILEQMVKQELLTQEAAKLGLDKKPEVQAQVIQQADQYRQDLKARIAMEQAQLGQIDKAVRSRVLIEELINVKGAAYGITEKQVQGYYDDLKKKGAGGNLPPFKQVWERIRQQMILDRVSDEAKEKNDVQVFMERLPEPKGEAGPPTAFPQGSQLPQSAPKR